MRVSLLVMSLLLCCSPDAKILILSGSHGTREGKEGRIVERDDDRILLQESQL